MFFLGTTKQLLRLFFFSTNHKAAYYLLDEVEKINNVLKTTLFPSDFPRTQQSITFYATYKATEFRNLLFYSLIFILNGHMKDKYYMETQNDWQIIQKIMSMVSKEIPIKFSSERMWKHSFEIMLQETIFDSISKTSGTIKIG